MRRSGKNEEALKSHEEEFSLNTRSHCGGAVTKERRMLGRPRLQESRKGLSGGDEREKVGATLPRRTGQTW